MTKMQHLILPRQAAISDLSALAGMTDLRTLRTDGHSAPATEGAVTDLSPLAGLTRLETLQLMTCAAEDLTPLSGLTGLKELRAVRRTEIYRPFAPFGPDPTGISGDYAQGKRAVFPGQPAAAVRHGADETAAEIRSDGTLSLSGLENMKQLKVLYLSGFQDTLACVDLEALSGLTGLTDLTLDIGRPGHRPFAPFRPSEPDLSGPVRL